MNDQPYGSYLIEERSEVNALKKKVRKLGVRIGLSEHRLAQLDIIIAEITSNFLKHAAPPGEVLYRSIRQGSQVGVEIVGIDRGPGMYNPEHSLQDGVSTTRTMGTGMGAIQRLSDQFDLYSLPHWGTLVLARLFDTSPPPTDAPVRCATLLVNYPGEAVCGDALSYKQRDTQHTFLLTDGLGHGPHAHEASAQAVVAFQETPTTDPAALIQAIHQRIARTRGAVGLVLTLDVARRTIAYHGVGNISLRKISEEKTQRALSTQGIIGQNVHQPLTVAPFRWSDDALFVLHSDGIGNRWDIDAYPGLRYRDPTLLAAALYKDHQRGKDDCSILVIGMNTPL